MYSISKTEYFIRVFCKLFFTNSSIFSSSMFCFSSLYLPAISHIN